MIRQINESNQVIKTNSINLDSRRLPLSIWTRIISCLDQTSKNALSQTSHRFNWMVNDAFTDKITRFAWLNQEWPRLKQIFNGIHQKHINNLSQSSFYQIYDSLRPLLKKLDHNIHVGSSTPKIVRMTDAFTCVLQPMSAGTFTKFVDKANKEVAIVYFDGNNYKVKSNATQLHFLIDSTLKGQLFIDQKDAAIAISGKGAVNRIFVQSKKLNIIGELSINSAVVKAETIQSVGDHRIENFLAVADHFLNKAQYRGSLFEFQGKNFINEGPLSFQKILVLAAEYKNTNLITVSETAFVNCTGTIEEKGRLQCNGYVNVTGQILLIDGELKTHCGTLAGDGIYIKENGSVKSNDLLYCLSKQILSQKGTLETKKGMLSCDLFVSDRNSQTCFENLLIESKSQSTLDGKIVGKSLTIDAVSGIFVKETASIQTELSDLYTDSVATIDGKMTGKQTVIHSQSTLLNRASLDIFSVSVHCKDTFSSNNTDILCKAYTIRAKEARFNDRLKAGSVKIKSDTIHFNGKNYIEYLLQLDAKEKLHFSGTCEGGNLLIDAKEAILSGKINVDRIFFQIAQSLHISKKAVLRSESNLTIHSKQAKIKGKLQAHDHTQLSAADEIILYKALVKSANGIIYAPKVTLNGTEVELESVTFLASNTVNLSGDSHIQSGQVHIETSLIQIAHAIIKTGMINCQVQNFVGDRGKIEASKFVQIDAKKAFNSMVIEAPKVYLTITENIQLHESSSIEGKELLYIRAQLLENRGRNVSNGLIDIDVKEDITNYNPGRFVVLGPRLQVKADRLWNTGLIRSEGVTKISLNYLLVHGLAKVHSLNDIKDAVVHAGIIGKDIVITAAAAVSIGGTIAAEKTFVNNSLVDAYFGLIMGSTTSTSLIRVKPLATIVNPMTYYAQIKLIIDGEYQQLFNNIRSAASSTIMIQAFYMLARSFAPKGVKNALDKANWAFSFYSMAQQLYSVYSAFKEVYAKYQDPETQGSLQFRDFIEPLAAVCNTTLDGYNLHKQWFAPAVVKKDTVNPYAILKNTAASLFLPSEKVRTLYNFEPLGATVMGSGTTDALYTFMSPYVADIGLSVHKRFHAAHLLGLIYAKEVNIVGNFLKFGAHVPTGNLTLNVDEIVLNAERHYNNATIIAQKIEQEANIAITGDQSKLIAGVHSLEKGAKMDFSGEEYRAYAALINQEAHLNLSAPKAEVQQTVVAGTLTATGSEASLGVVHLLAGAKVEDSSKAVTLDSLKMEAGSTASFKEGTFAAKTIDQKPEAKLEFGNKDVKVTDKATFGGIVKFNDKKADLNKVETLPGAEVTVDKNPITIEDMQNKGLLKVKESLSVIKNNVNHKEGREEFDRAQLEGVISSDGTFEFKGKDATLKSTQAEFKDTTRIEEANSTIEKLIISGDKTRVDIANGSLKAGEIDKKDGTTLSLASVETHVSQPSTLAGKTTVDDGSVEFQDLVLPEGSEFLDEGAKLTVEKLDNHGYLLVGGAKAAIKSNINHPDGEEKFVDAPLSGSRLDSSGKLFVEAKNEEEESFKYSEVKLSNLAVLNNADTAINQLVIAQGTDKKNKTLVKINGGSLKTNAIVKSENTTLDITDVKTNGSGQSRLGGATNITGGSTQLDEAIIPAAAEAYIEESKLTVNKLDNKGTTLFKNLDAKITSNTNHPEGRQDFVNASYNGIQINQNGTFVFISEQLEESETPVSETFDLPTIEEAIPVSVPEKKTLQLEETVLGGQAYIENAEGALGNLKLQDNARVGLNNVVLNTSGIEKAPTSSLGAVNATLTNTGTASLPGELKASELKIHSTEAIALSGNQELQNTSLTSDTSISVADRMNVDGNVALMAPNVTLSPQSNVEGEGRLEVDSKNPQLLGSINSNQFLLKSDTIPNIQDLLNGTGQYAKVQPKKVLSVVTNQPVDFRPKSLDWKTEFAIRKQAGKRFAQQKVEEAKQPLNRPIEIELTAPSIGMNAGLTAEALRFHSTQTPIAVNGTLNAKIVSLKTPQDVTVNRSINSPLIGVDAKNYVQNINVHAQKIFINTTNDVSINKRQLTAAVYLQIDAGGNIHAAGGKDRNSSRHSTSFSTSLIKGGTGEGYDAGLVMHAQGQVHNWGSTIGAIGNAVVMGDQGVVDHNLVHQYHKEHEKGFFKKKITHETKAQIERPRWVSDSGRVVSESSLGNIVTDATHYQTKFGVDLTAKKGVINLEGEILKTRKSTSTTFRLGIIPLSKKSSDRKKQDSVPTEFRNSSPGETRIWAYGKLTIKHVVFETPGALRLRSETNDIVYAPPILKQSKSKKEQEIGLSVFGFKIIGKDRSKMFHNDPLLSDTERLIHSRDPVEALLNLNNVGVEAINAINQVGNAIENKDLGSLTERVASGGVSPDITLGYDKWEERRKWETLAKAYINTNELEIWAAGNATMKGVGINADEASITAKRFEYSGVKLKESHQNSHNAVSVTYHPERDTFDVGGSHERSKGKGYHYSRPSMNIGHLDVNTDEFNLNNAHVDVDSIEGKLGRLNMRTDPDSIKARHDAWAASTDGSVSLQHGRHRQSSLNEQTLFRVNSSFTDDNVEVNTITSRAAILSAGKLQSSAEITLYDVKTSTRSNSFGFNTNLTSFTGDSNSSHLETVNLNKGGQNLKDIWHPVLHSDTTTQLNGKIGGQGHSVDHPANARETIRDESHDWKVKLVIPNEKNKSRINEAFGRATGNYKPKLASEELAQEIERVTGIKDKNEQTAVISDAEATTRLVYLDDSGKTSGDLAHLRIGDTFYDSETGCKVTMYFDDQRKVAYAAHAGTNGLPSIVKDDLPISRNELPTSIKNPLYQEFTQNQMNQVQNQGYTMIATGHSRGASQASYFSSKWKVAAIVTENPGINPENDLSRVINFKSFDNVVNSGINSGKGYTFELTPTPADQATATGIQAMKRVPGLAIPAAVAHAQFAHGSGNVKPRIEQTLNGGGKRVHTEAATYGCQVKESQESAWSYYESIVHQLSQKNIKTDVKSVMQKSEQHMTDKRSLYPNTLLDRNKVAKKQSPPTEIMLQATARSHQVTVAIIHTDGRAPTVIKPANSQATVYLAEENGIYHSLTRTDKIAPVNLDEIIRTTPEELK